MNPHYEEVAIPAGRRCEYCHAPEAVFNLPLEVEHIIPVSRGGGDSSTNWALACRACNLYKAAHVSGSDPISQEDVRLFHPPRTTGKTIPRLLQQAAQSKGLLRLGEQPSRV